MSPLLYYITDRVAFPGDEPARQRALLSKIADATRAGVDYIQLREKNLRTRDLESLATEAISVIRQIKLANPQLKTALLVNSRTDVAIATAADGVHLPAHDIPANEARQITSARITISVSCHQPSEIRDAQHAGGDLALFAPVFEKKDAPGASPTGLDALRQACQYSIPVLALGGVTLDNARACLDAGAAGIAAIRLFQDHDVAETVRRLRSL